MTEKFPILFADTPKGLLNCLWLSMTQQFGLRSFKQQTNMKWGDVELKVDNAGAQYVEFTERATKTRSGKTGEHRPFAPKAFENEGKETL